MTRRKTKVVKAGPVKNVGDRIIEGLTDLRDVLRAGTPLEKRYTVRTVEVPEPEEFDARRVRALRARALRARLQMSQIVFARLVGVSTILVQSWEQGVREPSPIARRLLAEVERDPRRWQRMIVTVPAEQARVRRKSA
jgi:putative transcriptional regulator